VHLFGFTVGIYYVARTYERQIKLFVSAEHNYILLFILKPLFQN